MAITVKAAREALEAAQSAYMAADIENPTAVSVARSALNEARMEYRMACVELCERMTWALETYIDINIEGMMQQLYRELTGQEVWK